MCFKAFVPISVHEGHLLKNYDRMKKKAFKAWLSFVADHCSSRVFSKDLERRQTLKSIYIYIQLCLYANIEIT